MPVYNASRYLTQAIDSILQQSYRNYEFLIINDGSQDDTDRIVRSYQDSRIKYLTNEQNLGISRSLNLGIQLASGKYIARMDADDISYSTRLEQQVAWLEAHNEVGILGSAVINIDSDGVALGLDKSPACTHYTLLWYQLFACPFIHPTVMMRSNVIQFAGGYSSEYEWAEDRELWYRLLTKSNGANLSESLLQFRRHSTNSSQVYASQQHINSARVTREAMSALLCYQVPLELCLAVEQGNYTSADQVLTAYHLIQKLYSAFLDKYELTLTEKKWVREDYARRLYTLAFSWRNDPRLWTILIRSSLVDYRVSYQWIAKRFLKPFEKITGYRNSHSHRKYT